MDSMIPKNAADRDPTFRLFEIGERLGDIRAALNKLQAFQIRVVHDGFVWPMHDAAAKLKRSAS